MSTFMGELARRKSSAMDRITDSAIEQFGLTPAQAKAAISCFVRLKVLRFDGIDGSMKLEDGRLWDREVLERAAALEAENA
jgi:hypothetical protein